MRRIQEFAPRTRRTTLPYHHWFTGEMLELEEGVDFHRSPERVARAILSWARRQDVAAIAFPVRDEGGHGPFRFVQVWGDLSRTWADGPPPEIRRELGEARRMNAAR